MTPEEKTIRVYRSLRSRGYRASEAIRNARVQVEFDACSARLTWEPDGTLFDDSYLDTWGLSPANLTQARARLRSQIEDLGVWSLVVEVPCCTCGAWRIVDSVSGLVGQDGGGYEFDLMASALAVI